MAGRHRFTGGLDRAAIGRGIPPGSEAGDAAARRAAPAGGGRVTYCGTPPGAARAGGSRVGGRQAPSPAPARRLAPARVQLAVRP